MQLHLRHDQNLAEIAGQLFILQANLIAKEKYLGQVIQDRDQVRLYIIFYGSNTKPRFCPNALKYTKIS